MRNAAMAGLALALLLVGAGCAMQGGEAGQQLADALARLDALEARATALEDARKAADAQAGETAKAVAADAERIDAMAKELEQVGLKVSAFREQISELTKANSGAQQTLIQSLEASLAIHEQQYMALKETLEQMKKKAAAVGAAKPE